MINEDRDMAFLAGWLEGKCGHIQGQCVLNQVTEMLRRKASLECMEIMLLADIIHGYRKEMLRQIKEFKVFRERERLQAVANFSVRKDLKCMKEAIVKAVACWADLRKMYFFERALYMERCKQPHSHIMFLSNHLYEKSPPKTA